MIIIDILNNNKTILVWDGKEKSIENHSHNNLIVRSSCVSYEKHEMEHHLNEFKKLLYVEMDSIIEIHETLVMPEKEKLPFFQTTSFTQIVVKDKIPKINFIPRNILV